VAVPSHEQESVGADVDDTAIATAVKGRYIDNKEVDASSISVETLKGTGKSLASST
jgi:osmotically-inducible protein OsmY